MGFHEPVAVASSFVLRNNYMSQRRMFSNRIANSARFLQMPVESQLLYFHFVLRADDDGVVEAYPVMKLLGFAPDSFKVLLGKSFVKVLNDEQVIVIIDWLEHNKIRADRKIDSIYKPLLMKECPEMRLVEAKPRSDVKDNTKRVGGQSTVSVREVRLGKVSKEEKDASSFERKKKPFYEGSEMRKAQGKWWVIPKGGGKPWLEYADKESEIEWK